MTKYCIFSFRFVNKPDLRVHLYTKHSQTIQQDLIHRLRLEYRLPPETTAAHAAQVVAAQAGISSADAALLTGASPSHEATVLDRAQEIDRIGRRVLGEPNPVRPSTELTNGQDLIDSSGIEEPSNV